MSMADSKHRMCTLVTKFNVRIQQHQNHKSMEHVQILIRIPRVAPSIMLTGAEVYKYLYKYMTFTHP